jgi:hypothetical protein
MFSVLIFVPFWVLSRSNLVVGEAIQPRYLLPLLISTIVVLTYPSKLLIFSRGQVLIFVFFLTLAQSVALHTQIRRYVTGQDYAGINLNLNMESWWLSYGSPNTLWIFGSISFLAWAIGFGLLMNSQLKSRN